MYINKYRKQSIFNFFLTFVRWSIVRSDFVRVDFVPWDFVMWDFVRDSHQLNFNFCCMPCSQVRVSFSTLARGGRHLFEGSWFWDTLLLLIRVLPTVYVYLFTSGIYNEWTPGLGKRIMYEGIKSLSLLTGSGAGMLSSIGDDDDWCFTATFVHTVG